MANRFALLGWSLPVIESMQKANKPFVVVSFPDFEPNAKEHDIPFVSYQLDEWGSHSNSLALAELMSLCRCTRRPWNGPAPLTLSIAMIRAYSTALSCFAIRR